MTTDPPSRVHANQTAFGTIAAASVMAECLRIQADVVPRSALARLLGRSPLSDEARPWYQGALGERDVAARLTSLDDSWTVLHSVPIGTRGSDIDHVIVGPAGVVTVNSKFHAGARVWVGSRRVLVNGQKTDHLRNTRYEAARTRKLLSAAVGSDVPVKGAIVIVGAKELQIRERPEDVAVLRSPQLVRWVTKQKPVLEPPQVAALAAAVRDRATWSEEPSPMPDTAAFEDLEREVGRARHTRMAWSAALLIGVLGITVPLAFDVYGRLLGG